MIWLLFSLSYKDNLPSSLTRVLSRALEYSSHPPVSVLVRSPSTARAYFSEALRYTIGSVRRLPLGHHLALSRRICLSSGLMVPRTLPIVRVLNVLRQPIANVLGGAGIFNLLSIAYAFRPQLRDRLTQGRRALPWKPWVYGEVDFHHFYRVLMPCIVTSIRSSAPHGTPSTLNTTLSYHAYCYASVISVLCFSPGYYRRRVSRLVSCYALFKWWLPLSQHPNCL